jgi:hypothetical protein
MSGAPSATYTKAFDTTPGVYAVSKSCIVHAVVAHRCSLLFAGICQQSRGLASALASTGSSMTTPEMSVRSIFYKDYQSSPQGDIFLDTTTRVPYNWNDEMVRTMKISNSKYFRMHEESRTHFAR